MLFCFHSAAKCVRFYSLYFLFFHVSQCKKILTSTWNSLWLFTFLYGRVKVRRKQLMTTLHLKEYKGFVILLIVQTFAPCDFWLFPLWKRALLGVRFVMDADSEDLQGNSFGGVEEDTDSGVAGMCVPMHPASRMWNILRQWSRVMKMLAISAKNWLNQSKFFGRIFFSKGTNKHVLQKLLYLGFCASYRF